MHANHKAVNQSMTVCDDSSAIQGMRKRSLCVQWAREHGKQSDSLWSHFRWQNNCVTLKHVPVPILT